MGGMQIIFAVRCGIFNRSSLPHGHQQDVTLPCQRSPVEKRSIPVQREVPVQILMCLDRFVQSTDRQREPQVRHRRRMVAAVEKLNLPIHLFTLDGESLIEAYIRRKLPEYLYLIGSGGQNLWGNIGQRDCIAFPPDFVSQIQIAQILPVVYIVADIVRPLKDERAYSPFVRTDFHLGSYTPERRNIQTEKE